MSDVMKFTLPLIVSILGFVLVVTCPGTALGAFGLWINGVAMGFSIGRCF